MIYERIRDPSKPNRSQPARQTYTFTRRYFTTGAPHLGNYVGAIRPAIQSSQNSTNEEDKSFFFLADYHSIIKCSDPKQVHESTKAIAATWLACGLDPEKVVFYRQSDVPEIPELAWILNCSCSKGLMNRAHAYKAAVDANNEKADVDPDHGITMGPRFVAQHSEWRRGHPNAFNAYTVRPSVGPNSTR